MSHEKDKRGSKLFGTRLSSIFGDSDKGTRSVPTPTSNPKNNLLKQSLITKSSNSLRPQQSNSTSNTATSTTKSMLLDHKVDSRSIPATRSLLDPITPKKHETTSAKTVNKQLDLSPITSPGIGSPQLKKLHRKRPPDIQDDPLPSLKLTPSSEYTSPNYNSNPHSNTSNRDSNLDALASSNVFHPDSPESDDFQFNPTPAREAFVINFDNLSKYDDDNAAKLMADPFGPRLDLETLQDLQTKTSMQDQSHSSPIKKSLEYQSQDLQHVQSLDLQGTRSYLSQVNQQQSNMNDLIDSIENQINYFNVDSDSDANLSDDNITDPNSSRNYSKIPRSPNIMQLSDFSEGQQSPIKRLAQLSSTPKTNSPKVEKDSFLSALENSRTPTPLDSNDWNEYSNTSPLKSNNSFNFTNFPLDANPKRISLKKDSFLDFSSPANDSLENFHTPPIKEFEGLSAKPMGPVDITDYASENSTSHSDEPSKSSSNEPTLEQTSRTLTKMSDSAYGEFKVPEEYKMSSESSLDNPIIENNAMVSPRPGSFIVSQDIQAPYPISTPGITPPLSPSEAQHDLVSREVSIKSTNSSFDRNIESLLSRKSSETSQAFPRKSSTNLSGSTSRTLSYGSKKNMLKPVLSTPLESTQTFTADHKRQSSSISSIFSSHSNKPANLATIKKGLNLKPGEGERSNYVLLIRRSAGTAYNENGPGKWKLPIGIKPVDKASLASNANGRYKRLAGPFNQNRLKKSGVELKHGHLQPRLLAGEIDDKDTGIRQKIGTISELKPVIPETKLVSMSPVTSGTNLARVSTVGSTNTMDVQSIAASSTMSSTIEESIVSSSSSESLNGAIGGGYYQHPGYKYSPGGGDDTEIETGSMDNDDEYEERGKLVLANPDVSSDSN